MPRLQGRTGRPREETTEDTGPGRHAVETTAPVSLPSWGRGSLYPTGRLEDAAVKQDVFELGVGKSRSEFGLGHFPDRMSFFLDCSGS